MTKLLISASSSRARFSAMSANEYFGSTPRKSGRSPACRLRSTSTVRAAVAAARLVAMKDVPHHPCWKTPQSCGPFSWCFDLAGAELGHAIEHRFQFVGADRQPQKFSRAGPQTLQQQVG